MGDMAASLLDTRQNKLFIVHRAGPALQPLTTAVSAVFPLMVFRVHLSKLRLALNGISTRTVKCGDQHLVTGSILWAVVKQQRSERVVHFAKKASCVVLPPACESSNQEWGCFPLRQGRLPAMLDNTDPTTSP